MSSTSHPVLVVLPRPVQEVSSSPIPVVSSHHPISVVSSHSVQVASSCSNLVVSSCPKSKPSVEKRGEGSRIQRTFLGDQDCLPVQVIPHEKQKLQKNLPSVDQVSYAPASFNHSSLPGNQCGSSLYMLPHEVITVKVYMSQENHHFPPEPDRRNPFPKLPRRQTSLANQMAHLHSLSTTELLAQARHLSGLPLIKSNLPNPSPELNDPKGLVHPPPEPSVNPFFCLSCG